MKKSLLNMEQLLSAVKGRALNNKKDCYFEKVATDSREVVENTLFVPLLGKIRTGTNIFLRQLKRKQVLFL